PFTSSLSLFTLADLSGGTSYLGAKAWSTSTPSSDLGRSRTWPKEASTTKPDPRYRAIVLALAGDSTISTERPAADAPHDGPPFDARCALVGCGDREVVFPLLEVGARVPRVAGVARVPEVWPVGPPVFLV